jgi:internalin A
MKSITKILSFVILLCFVNAQLANSQSNRDWWNSLTPGWKKVFQKQELKGKNIDPSDEQLDRIVKITQIDCSNNIDILDLKPLGRLDLLEEIRCSKSGIKSLEGLESLKNLRVLDCSDNDNINSLIPLEGITSLEKLFCGNTMVKDLKPLRQIVNLKVLDVHFATVSELLFIGALVNLEKLDISQNQSLFNLKGAEKLINLTELKCNDTKVNDLQPLSVLTKLELLDCSNTPVLTLKPLQVLKNLKDLNCSDTNIKGASLDYLLGMLYMERFRCMNNDISQQDKEQFESTYKKKNGSCTIVITVAKK